MKASWWTGLLQARKTARGNTRMNYDLLKFTQKLFMDAKSIAYMPIYYVRSHPNKNMQLTCITTKRNSTKERHTNP